MESLNTKKLSCVVGSLSYVPRKKGKQKAVDDAIEDKGRWIMNEVLCSSTSTYIFKRLEKWFPPRALQRLHSSSPAYPPKERL